MEGSDFVSLYFDQEINPLMVEIYEDTMDQKFEDSKNKINKLIYKLQELRRHLHDNNE